MRSQKLFFGNTLRSQFSYLMSDRRCQVYPVWEHKALPSVPSLGTHMHALNRDVELASCVPNFGKTHKFFVFRFSYNLTNYFWCCRQLFPQIICQGIVWRSQNFFLKKHACFHHNLLFENWISFSKFFMMERMACTQQILLMAPEVFTYQFLVEFVSVPNFFVVGAYNCFSNCFCVE